MNATTDTPSAFTWCKQRLGEQQTAAMLDFASHAALPVALNSELLHLIRLNFFHNAPLLDYTAEAELLLSPLCREIGADLYELLPEARGELLKHLYRKYPGRVTRLSKLIGCYSKTCPAWLKLETLRKSQLLTALLHLNPSRSAELIKQHQDRIQHSEEQEEHEWLLAMHSEAKLGEQAQSVRTPAFFIVSHLEKANPWQERPEFEDLKNWWQENKLKTLITKCLPCKPRLPC
ncbi:hypothetical protein QUF61_08330 [Candidatus Venteria ishoeyi]|uniref:hypothetical protein n=1 Tax=Candidatus Venteria ishoeyi TaxID=1899563 RepID=UPI0025A5B169|nr:hypothetical protein [Candidatus Venteria ishoeyi]MDM8546488.1 hypothetical protein [Candidatus Venteria ishoeyi]